MFKENLKISDTAKNEIQNTSTEIQNNQSVNLASSKLAKSASDGFNNNTNGKQWGADLSENISSGMTSQKSQSRITGAATSIAGWIKSIIGHSVPETGPLKDELTYMPDMIDNLVKGIEKNKYKIVDTTEQLAGDIKDSFNLEELNSEIISKMNRAVAMETGSINATASIKSNNSMLNVIQANFSIDGSVDIDGQRAGRILAPKITKTIKAGGLI